MCNQIVLGGIAGGVVTFTGLFTGIAVHIPCWNWWQFPTNHTVVCLTDITVGWLLVGLPSGSS
jgi:hypothetical protein